MRADDADQLLEARIGEPIETFFDRDGEAAFREREEELVDALLDRADGGVIALGGGALGSERVRDALHRHTVVLLDVDAETAWERVVRTGPPAGPRPRRLRGPLSPARLDLRVGRRRDRPRRRARRACAARSARCARSRTG